MAAAEEKEAEESSAGGANQETDAVSGGNPPTSGDDWVELLVREVLQSSGTDDAKVRAARVLEALEKMLSARAREEAGKKFQEVNHCTRVKSFLLFNVFHSKYIYPYICTFVCAYILGIRP